MDIAASHPSSAPSWSNSLSLGGFASHDHSQHGEDGSCPFCNSLRQQHSGTGQNLNEQASGAAGVAAGLASGLAGAAQPASPLAPRDVVSLSQRSDQGQALTLGLDLGYGPDARPVTAGVFEEQPHREPFPGKEGQGDGPPDQDGSPKEAQAAGRDDSDRQDEIPAVRDESELSSEDRQLLEQLRQRDAEVRAHEQAHVAAGGQYVTAGASYTYETGPDGRQYAVGGEVSIDTSPVPGNPEQTEQKAQTIRRAALAPASPSAQDVKVATSAAQMEAEARMERVQKEQEERQTGSNGGPTSPNRIQDQTASDQAASSHAGFFSRSPDFAFFPQSFPAVPAPSNNAASLQAYRNQLAFGGTANLV